MTQPVLIFGYGNLSRGDDALGPLLLEAISDKIDTTSVEILTDFQLQIEHALDLEKRTLVLFIDASVSCKKAFDFFELQASKDKSYTTHAMNPAAIMQVYQSIKKQPSPPCFLLSIQGISFELGEPLSMQAENNLQHALQFAKHLLKNTEIDFWQLQQSDLYFAQSRMRIL
jgi:hydrogenase maturation protease